jgi:RNA polymerase sigma factor (sigma-70 family)
MSSQGILMEPNTAQPLPVEVVVGGRTFLWTPEEGLDPAAIAAIDRYCWRQARRYQHAAATGGHTLDDLYQAARMGALVAARSYDPARATRFLTWAAWRIRSEIQGLLECGEVAIPAKHRPELIATGNMPGLRSLDAPIAGADVDLWSALVADTQVGEGKDPFRSAQLHRVWRVLGERDRDILARRFGLFGLEEQTLDEIGAVYSLSRERVRQIEAKALQRLGRLMGGR